jgi:pyruvate,water dikinase
MAQHFTFKDSSLPTVEQVGGKGLSLIYLENRGFTVPINAVLSTEFFQPWMERLKASPEWKAFAQTKTDDMVAAATAVKNSAQTLTFSEDQQQTLSEVRQHLQTEGTTLMAVRSSSPEEDLEGASFAGIYETVLGVTEGNLEAAIKTCFSSALDERVVAYKQKRGFDPLDPKIALIIQKQIASEVSGVAFSLNPVTNCYDECVINANFGLGVTVVEGTITPDQFIVDKVTNVILEKTPGQKDVAIYLKADGGTESKALDSPSEFCLSDEQLLAVTSLAAQVEAEYGKPMDIEWAYEGGQLYLLQARPITTYYRLPDEMITLSGEQKHLYQDINLTEQGLPENMSPLGEEIFIRFTGLMSEVLGADANIVTFERGMIFGCAGRSYSNIGRMVKMMGKKNVINTYRIIDQIGTDILYTMDLKEYIPKKLPKGLMVNFIKTALGGIKIVMPMMRASRKPDDYLRIYLEENERLKSSLKAEYERDTPIGDFYVIALKEVATYLNTVSLPALLAAERARGNIKKMFKGESEAVQEHLHYIEQAFPHNVTIEMSLVLHDLSQFSHVQDRATPEEFVQKLDSNQLSPEFMEKWQFFIEHYGFRCPKEIDVATPRYYERPGEVFTLLKMMGTDDDPDLTPRGIFENAIKRRVESAQFLEDYLSKKSRRKVKAFKKKYKVLESFAAYREMPKYYVIIAVDYIRRRALAIAKRWVAAGRLDSVNQIFDLELNDISRAEKDASLDIRAIAQANRAYVAQFNPHNDPPVLIDSRGRIPTLPPRPLKENELMGTPVSPGLVIGPVKVLTRPDEKPILPGDILVTKATDPGWTPLFLNARGVLLESGGTLQHGAAVARETCKPCIVGIERVTKILTDDQIVELDGATGIIKILSESTPNPA